MSWLMREDQRMVEKFLLQGVITLAEARRLRTPSAQDPFLRDAVDNLLMDLSGYPLREGGPRSGLDQLEYFSKAIAREPTEFAHGLDTRVGKIVLDATSGLTHENRAERRWAILDPLGAPRMDRREAGMNVWVRLLSSRVTDGLLHPVLCAELIADVGPLSADDAYNSREVQINRAAPGLYKTWVSDPGTRDSQEHSMRELFESVSWARSLS
ncbi:hypothetical protein ACFTZB_30605 [Rhodococcus sp. NPDC057014]|uniref:hypothetical protein n=1 Tax=Rhodococcus sp. NPDC057014 TaxID=3346000 RepID=UPI0036271879